MTKKAAGRAEAILSSKALAYEHLTVDEDSAFAPAQGASVPRKPFNAQERLIGLTFNAATGLASPAMDATR